LEENKKSKQIEPEEVNAIWTGFKMNAQ